MKGENIAGEKVEKDKEEESQDSTVSTEDQTLHDIDTKIYKNK